VSQDEKNRSHERIVASAARLLRTGGVEGASVGDVMSAAGLTHGGFYRHFDAKDAMVAAALESAFAEFTSALDEQFARTEPATAVADYIATYLSDGHVTHPDRGCPMPAVGADIARGSENLKRAFGAGLAAIAARLAAGFEGSEVERRDKAARKLAMLVGAVLIARASDPETGRAVLDACRRAPVDA
jgi:TetR/AcrR family transcriptional repressor of nem operon